MENQNNAASEFKIPGVDDVENELPPVDELATLKARADMIGLKYHPNIGLDTLKAKLAEHLAAEGTTEQPAAATETPLASSAPAAVPEPAPVPEPVSLIPPPLATPVPSAAPLAPAPIEPLKYRSPLAHANEISQPIEGETLGQARVRMKRHASELIRIRLTCMNPAKKEWEGEIFTAGNSLVGSLKKYVPFAAEDGWHVPRIIYNMIRDRQCQVFHTVTNKATGIKHRQGKLIREFAIEVMEPLERAEIEDLAARQAATNAID